MSKTIHRTRLSERFVGLKIAQGAILCAVIITATVYVNAKPHLLDRAIAAAGGKAALTRAKRLVWEGEANVHAGGRDIGLAVRSDIVPFGHIRSETWLRDQGPSTMRVLELDGRNGWTIRDGKKDPLAAPMAENEYSQFGTYALMRLVPLRDRGVHIKEVAPDANGLQGIEVNYPGLPEATLWFDKQAHLVALTNTVSSPTGGAAIAQRFEFKGTVKSNGVSWPSEIRITQDGKPFFELRISKFQALPS